MKQYIRHTIFLVLLLLAGAGAIAQQYGSNVRYVQCGTRHSLTVPENPDYRFQWEITRGLLGQEVINVDSTSNVTEPFTWDCYTYNISVYPILDSVGCKGEPIYMKLIGIENLSLHAITDAFYMYKGDTLYESVARNDFDEQGEQLYYSATPAFPPMHGTVWIDALGDFSYIPDPNFVGLDSFNYVVRNSSMDATAWVYIQVQDPVNWSNLYVEKTGPKKALSGSLINYQIIVKNNGPDLARNVILRDSIPFGLFTPEYSLGGPMKPWEGYISLGDLKSGDSVLVTLRARISPNTPRGSFIYNQALTYSNSYDVSISDNDSIWRTEVLPLYVDLPDQLMVAGCRPTQIPNLTEGNDSIVSYRWTPSTGLSSDTIPNPTFVPDASNVGRMNPYILTVVDVLGNVASDTINIFVSDIPVATIDSDTIVDGIGKIRFRDLGETIPINGSQSTGDMLNFFWWAENEYGIVSSQSDQLVRVDSLGKYYLIVTDLQGCPAIDSVTVLYESHPPIAVKDYVEIVAGTDSTINVLDNDYDLNLFELEVSRIVGELQHGTYEWDSLGNITYTPNKDAWPFVYDTIQYEVCNNGLPVSCSVGLMVIKIIRPPLNADVVIAKSGPQYAFWDDSIRYDLLIYSNGPDTASVISVDDQLDYNFLKAPTYRVSADNGATWSGWSQWRNNKLNNLTSKVIPVSSPSGGTQYRIQISAFIPRPTTPRFGVKITNKAFIDTDILENDHTSDTSSCVTYIREPVIARAGGNKIVGSCDELVELDGSRSGGEHLLYEWSPSRYFDDPTNPTPIFIPQETGLIQIVLTVTDTLTINGEVVEIIDRDTITVNVLKPPRAIAGDDVPLREGELVTLNGSNSEGSIRYWRWTNPAGEQISVGPITAADTVGYYYLTVTDIAGCSNTDSVFVYQFYYSPFAIPDYYSTEINKPISSDDAGLYRGLMYNDFEPNGLFDLSVMPVSNLATSLGGRVTIFGDGQFNYTPPVGKTGVDVFTYQLCNNGNPRLCDRGYVQITINNQIQMANLSIDKKAQNPSALIGATGILFSLTITNHGPSVATNITVTDTLSPYISDWKYSYDGLTYRDWNGSISGLKLEVDSSRVIYVSGKLTEDAPGRVFNAATVSSPIYDPEFDWNNEEWRNVDTASVIVVSDLLARASLVELFDNNKNDMTIGHCDTRSYLRGDQSISTVGIDNYSWSPPSFLVSPNAANTTFNFEDIDQDTTIVFTLTINKGLRASYTKVTVNISAPVIADAGPDRKMNEGTPLVLEPTGNEGVGVNYEWWKGDRNYTSAIQVTNFDGDPLRPILSSPGVYYLYAQDKHGCIDIDTVVIRENQLFALNDILVVIAGKSQTGIVGTNDYDPNTGDSIFFPGTIVSGPFHGTLSVNPPGYGGVIINNGARMSNNGTFVYQPNPGFIGDDYLTYKVCDSNDPMLCVNGKVFIKVIDVDAVNSQPVANHDVFFVNRNDTLDGNLIANDYDFDGGTFTIHTTPVTPPRKGTVTLHADGTFTYVPTLNAEAADSFQYRIFDNGKPVKYDTTWVAIYIHKIEEENHKPVAVDDAYYVVEDSITGNLMLNDYDPDGNFISMDYMATYFRTAHGTINLTDQYGSFVYTPDAGFEGTDQLIYSIVESGTIEKYSTQATVYFTCLSEKRYKTDVEIVKTGPAEILSGSLIQYTLTARVLGPTLANDVVISDTLSVEHIATRSAYSTDGGVSWQPWTGKFHIDRMMLYADTSILIRSQLIDTLSGNLSNVGWVGHDMTESKPVNNRSEWITSVYQKVIADAGNDTIIGSCVKEYKLDGTGSIGMNTLQYRWTPTADLRNANTATPTYATSPDENQQFTLIVSCTYRGFTDSDTATVRVRVAGSPKADPGREVWNATEDVVLDGSKSYAYGSIDYLWWHEVNGKVIVIDSTATITVKRGGKYYLTVTDTFGCVSTAWTNVGFEVEPVIAVDDYVETPQDEPVDIYVLRNDIIDEEDEFDISTVVVSSDPSHGSVVWSEADSAFIYTPDAYYVGYDTFTYIVSTLSSNDEAMVVINVLDRPAIVPQGFSPNGDGINDVLHIQNIEKYPNNSFIVFNRWGNVVYKKDKYTNSDAWNGVANKGIRIGSGAVPAGVYLYVLTLGDDRIKQPLVKGNIYIATDNR